MVTVRKKIRTINIEADKCNGCRGCEVICSLYHADPKYSSINPARSRIHVLHDRLKDIWLPVFAGEYTPAECAGRDRYVIAGKVYDECAFCRAACPSRDLFKDPVSGLPLRCDMCEGEDLPLCVQACLNDVLTYEEREEEAAARPASSDLEAGLASLVDTHGLEKITAAVSRMFPKN